MSGYMVFWSKDRIKALNKAGDNGPIHVIYGGRHTKEPSLKKIKVGDVLFPVSLEKEGRFIRFHDGAGYLSKIAIPNDTTRIIDINTLSQKKCALHQIPITCCSEIAAVGTGSLIKPRPIPEEKVPLLLFGNSKSTMKGLGQGTSGKITSISLSGHVRKMSPETKEVFESLFGEE